MNIRESDDLVVGGVGSSGPVSPQKWEVSLRHLHRRWAEIDKLNPSQRKNLIKCVFSIQRTGRLEQQGKEGKNVREIPPNQISNHPRLKNIYPNGVQLGITLKICLGGKPRMYMAYDDDVKASVRRVYLICVDPNHEIDPD